MSISRISDTVKAQKDFFRSGKTGPNKFRIYQLKQLKRMIKHNENKIQKALHKDLGKSAPEAYLTEIREVLREIRYAAGNLKKWTATQRVPTPFLLKPGKSYIRPEPLGVALIISPWNYPLSLLLMPLVGAIAAGNCAVLKPSSMASETSAVIAELVQEYFSQDFISVVQGRVEATTSLLEEPFDHIFFTGSERVGKIVMSAAAKQLIPVTLELGGKSPCIVDSEIDLKVAAKRIAWGKYLNAGQTCIAPDYILVNQEVKDSLISAIREQISNFYGEDPKQSNSYCRIINRDHFHRLEKLLQSGNIVFGGETDPEQLYIAPTLLDNPSLNSPVMSEEIFGPILPVIGFETVRDAVEFVDKHSKPLAMYVFSNNEGFRDYVLENTSSGGACVNDTIMHVTSPELPFGGVGKSGMGCYHGKYSFDTFTHYKSILKKPFKLDMFLRYPPFKPISKHVFKNI